MRLAPNGDIFLTETAVGAVEVLRPSADGATAAKRRNVCSGAQPPVRRAAFSPAKNPKWLYIAETNRVVRYPYRVGDQKASALPEIVVPLLSARWARAVTSHVTSSSHPTAGVYVRLGRLGIERSRKHAAKKSPAEIKTWEAVNGLGATWDTEEKRAEPSWWFAVGKNDPGKVFATGIRNCAGLTMQPGTGTTVVHDERARHVG